MRLINYYTADDTNGWKKKLYGIINLVLSPFFQI